MTGFATVTVMETPGNFTQTAVINLAVSVADIKGGGSGRQAIYLRLSTWLESTLTAPRFHAAAALMVCRHRGIWFHLGQRQDRPSLTLPNNRDLVVLGFTLTAAGKEESPVSLP